MSTWSIQLCETVFSRKKLFGSLYYLMNGVPAGHSFIRLVNAKGKPDQELHSGAIHVNEDSLNGSRPYAPMLVLADSVLPDRLSRQRLFSWVYNDYECEDNNRLRGRTRLLEGSRTDILRRWTTALEFAARVNTENRRYNFLDSNCNTMAAALCSSMGVSLVKTTTSTFGRTGALNGQPVDSFAEYFNLYADASFDSLITRQQELTAQIKAGVRPRGATHQAKDLIHT